MENLENSNPDLENDILKDLDIKPKKTFFKRRKKLIIWSSIGLVLIILIIVGIASAGKKIEYTTVLAEHGELKQSVDATGKVESAETIELNFKTTGRIAQIYVKAGDKVTAGQRLAMLEAGALNSSVADAQARLNQSLADHQKLLAGSSDEDIRILENKLEQERADLWTSQKNLENLKLSQSTELNNLKESTLTTLNNELTTTQAALEEIEDTLTDEDAQGTLSIKNTTVLNTALDNQLIAEETFTIVEDLIDGLSFNSTNDEILNALESLKNNLDEIATTLSNTLDVLVATITSSDLSKSELDTLKSNIKTRQGYINTAKTNLNTAKSNWTNKIVYYTDQINTYEAAIETAENNFRIAQAQLDAELSPPRQFEIDSSLAKVAQARANLNLNLSRLNDAIITAPVDGTLTKRYLEPGEYASLANPVLEMIGESNLQIEVDIPESDIAKISLMQDVSITLDAFSSDDVFEGKVVFVDPAETIISDVVYYKVKVQFNELEELKNQIKPGMTANVTICTNKKENVLMVPARAVKRDNGDKYVEVLKGTKKKPVVEKVNVTTGLRGDSGIEIISGLKEGMEVVVFVKE